MHGTGQGVIEVDPDYQSIGSSQVPFNGRYLMMLQCVLHGCEQEQNALMRVCSSECQDATHGGFGGFSSECHACVDKAWQTSSNGLQLDRLLDKGDTQKTHKSVPLQ